MKIIHFTQKADVLSVKNSQNCTPNIYTTDCSNKKRESYVDSSKEIIVLYIPV